MSRLTYGSKDGSWGLFQSTLPVRGATALADAIGRCAEYFNPRSP